MERDRWISLGDLVGDVVAGKASKGLRRVLGRRGPADGSAGCALKIISGSQDGLSQHRRPGAAQFAPGELRFARHGIARPPVTLLGARQTAGRVSISPLEDCFIAQLQTPTATLALAMPGRAARPGGPGPDAQRETTSTARA